LNKKTVVGIATIGQSPRVDVVPELKEMAGVGGDSGNTLTYHSLPLRI